MRGIVRDIGKCQTTKVFLHIEQTWGKPQSCVCSPNCCVCAPPEGRRIRVFSKMELPGGTSLGRGLYLVGKMDPTNHQLELTTSKREIATIQLSDGPRSVVDWRAAVISAYINRET